MRKTAIVCGGRNYKNQTKIAQILSKLNPNKIVTGAATGADQLAEDWARTTQLNYEGYPAKWRRNGKRGGPMRNAEILHNYKQIKDLCVVVAFPGGRGTSNMIKQAEEFGFDVVEVDDDPYSTLDD